MDSPRPSPPSEPVRLQRFLASCGLGSRRACEELITAGRVSVDGRVVDTLGSRVVPSSSRVTVDGRVVAPSPLRYLVLHKPPGYLCTARDTHGRRTVFDLLPDTTERFFTIGRLDRDSEGLLLCTNDGAFAHALGHPRRSVDKVYRVWVSRPLSDEQREQFLKGIDEGGERLRCVDLAREEAGGKGFVYRVVLHEGRKRQIRRMFAWAGSSVRRLQRTEVGPLALGNLAPGHWRELTSAEVEALQKAAAGK